MSSKIVNIKQEEPEIVVTNQIKRSSNYIPPVPLNRMNGWPVRAETEPYWIYVPPNVPWTRESLFPKHAQVPRPAVRPSYGKEVSRNQQTRVHPSTVEYKASDGQIYYREANRHDAPKSSHRSPVDYKAPSGQIYHREASRHDAVKSVPPSTHQYRAPGGQIYHREASRHDTVQSSQSSAVHYKAPDGNIYYREEMKENTFKRPIDTVYYKPSTLLRKKRKLENDNNSQYRRPSLSFVSLIIMAIMKHPEEKCSCSDIYKFIIENFPFYETFDGHWKNAVRHNLSVSPFITKIPYEGRVSDYAIDPTKKDEAIKVLNSDLDKEVNKIIQNM